MKTTCSIALICAIFLSTACNNQQNADVKNTDSTGVNASTQVSLKEEEVTYEAGDVTMKGLVVYDENKKGPRPGILIVHEWWGLNEYPKNRAKQLAEMGYIAFAVDMFGNGKIAADPGEAQALTAPFYKNPQLARTRLDAALQKLKQYAQTDSSKVAAIGYCYGGFVVLNAAKLGADLDGVVSFHGGLGGARPNKNLLKAKVLVCHGEADKFESPEEISTFRRQMDSIGADYTFKTYADATHAFTNPESNDNAKKFNMPIAYNPAADKASWNDMHNFFNKLFGTAP